MSNKKNRIEIYLLATLFFILLILLVINLSNLTSAEDVKYCCEKTNYGAWCQNAPLAECDKTSGLRAEPTSCEAVSYCRQGCCYDSSEGTCMENTPQKVCQNSGGTWSDDKQCDVPQCNLGCCILGSQAAFTTLTRCKKLSGFYGLMTDFRTNIGTELDCISLANQQDQGACVFELDYSRTCKFSSRQECNSMQEGTAAENGTVTGNITFYKDYLCSAEDLGSICGLTKETTCIEGKDEVYFKDSCGNPANIYDADKINDKSYWRKIVSKADSCGASSKTGNSNSNSCGNCDYFSGSICKDYKKANVNPSYGNNICSDLNCKTTSLGKPMKHGESWCSTDLNQDSVGSRYFRHLCMNGEEILEPCADFRQEECIQDYIESKAIKFSQAACRVNRWQDCFSQTEKIDCENTDKRDCKWTSNKDEEKNNSLACIPLHSPGLTFWETGDSQTTCSKASTQCVVTFEKQGLITGSKKCVKNCECLADKWKEQQLTKCEAIGDCGGKVNFAGIEGNKEGYKLTTTKVSDKKSGGGLLGMAIVLNRFEERGGK